MQQEDEGVVEGEVLLAERAADVTMGGIVGALQSAIHLQELVRMRERGSIGHDALIRCYRRRARANVSPYVRMAAALRGLEVL
jgi:hypothetical protein